MGFLNNIPHGHFWMLAGMWALKIWLFQIISIPSTGSTFFMSLWQMLGRQLLLLVSLTSDLCINIKEILLQLRSKKIIQLTYLKNCKLRDVSRRRKFKNVDEIEVMRKQRYCCCTIGRDFIFHWDTWICMKMKWYGVNVRETALQPQEKQGIFKSSDLCKAFNKVWTPHQPKDKQGIFKSRGLFKAFNKVGIPLLVKRSKSPHIKNCLYVK